MFKSLNKRGTIIILILTLSVLTACKNKNLINDILSSAEYHGYFVNETDDENSNVGTRSFSTKSFVIRIYTDSWFIVETVIGHEMEMLSYNENGKFVYYDNKNLVDCNIKNKVYNNAEYNKFQILRNLMINELDIDLLEY